MNSPEKFNPEELDANYVETEAKELIESLELEKTEAGKEMAPKGVPGGKQRTEKGKEKKEKRFVVVAKEPDTGRLLWETNPMTKEEAEAEMKKFNEKHPGLDVEMKK